MAKKRKGTKYQGVPGNTLAEQQIFDELVRSVGRGWLNLVAELHKLAKDGTQVHRVSIKGLWEGHEGMLVVLVADSPEGPVVAFHNAPDPTGLPAGLAQRLAKGALKWKDDEYV